MPYSLKKPLTATVPAEAFHCSDGQTCFSLMIWPKSFSYSCCHLCDFSSGCSLRHIWTEKLWTFFLALLLLHMWTGKANVNLHRLEIFRPPSAQRAGNKIAKRNKFYRNPERQMEKQPWFTYKPYQIESVINKHKLLQAATEYSDSPCLKFFWSSIDFSWVKNL